MGRVAHEAQVHEGAGLGRGLALDGFGDLGAAAQGALDAGDALGVAGLLDDGAEDRAVGVLGRLDDLEAFGVGRGEVDDGVGRLGIAGDGPGSAEGLVDGKAAGRREGDEPEEAYGLAQDAGIVNDDAGQDEGEEEHEAHGHALQAGARDGEQGEQAGIGKQRQGAEGTKDVVAQEGHCKGGADGKKAEGAQCPGGDVLAVDAAARGPAGEGLEAEEVGQAQEEAEQGGQGGWQEQEVFLEAVHGRLLLLGLGTEVWPWRKHPQARRAV